MSEGGGSVIAVIAIIKAAFLVGVVGFVDWRVLDALFKGFIGGL